MPEDFGFNTPDGQPYTVEQCVKILQDLNLEGHLTLGEFQSLIYHTMKSTILLQ